MSERDGTSGGSRRPTYGLPGPLPGSDGPATQDPYPAPGGSGYGAPGYGTPDQGAPGHVGPAYGPGSGPDPVRQSGTPKKRRRGIIPLVIGLVLLVVVAPLVTIGGLVWAFGSLASDTMTGPEVLNGGSGEVSIAANEMIIVYVPSEDADSTTCTAESTGQSNDVVVTPTSGTVALGDGQSYEQTIGVAALADSTVTVTCEGTDAPAYLGPYSLFGIAGPMLIGPAIGILAGLVGLVLVIVGIVKPVRSKN